MGGFQLKKIIIVGSGRSEIPPGRIPAGIQEIDYQVSRQLAKYFMVTVISPFYVHFMEEKRQGNLKIKYVFHPASSGTAKARMLTRMMEATTLVNYSFWALVEFVRETRDNKGSVALIFSEKQSGLLSALAARVMGVETVFSESNPFPWYIPKPFRPTILSRVINLAFALIATKLSTHIRAQSSRIKKEMIKYKIDDNKITVIPGGVDTEVFKPQNGSSARHDIQVGYVGRLQVEKGLPLLYDIIRSFRTNSRSNAEFVIAGTGNYFERLRSLPGVTALGNVTRIKLPEMMNNCDFFIGPHEDLALTILEEMSCGRPVIALDSEDIRSGVAHMFNGILCREKTTEFLRAIELLIKNDELRFTLGKNARFTAINKYSWQRIGEMWKEMLARASELVS